MNSFKALRTITGICISCSVVFAVMVAPGIAWGATADDEKTLSSSSSTLANTNTAVPQTSSQSPDAVQNNVPKESLSAEAGGVPNPVTLQSVSDGWALVDGCTYYYQAGVPVKGSLCVDGDWYRFDLQDGHMLTGWQDIDGQRYYYDPDTGKMLFRNQCIAGNWYWFDQSAGFMYTGSEYLDGNWYRYDLQDGHMLFGSQYIDGHWYYYDSSAGFMHFGSTLINGKWYWYDLSQGFMLFGSQDIYGSWYWYDLNEGYMRMGWQDIYGHKYYYDPSTGGMYFGKHLIDGVWYRFHARQGYQVTLYRVYLDAGHGWNSSNDGEWDEGAEGCGYSEANLTHDLVNDVAAVCRSRYGIEVVTHTDETSVNYRLRQSQAVDDGCSTLVSIHFNADGGTGYESYIHSYDSPAGSETVQDIMHAALGSAIGVPDRGKQEAPLALVGRYLPSTLLEVCFIDQQSDMDAYWANRAALVDSLAAGINEMQNHEECIGSGL